MGARTPEELETMLEDAFVLRDREAVAQLFEERAVLAAAAGEARGREQIGRLAAAIWQRDHSYLAGSERVLQAGDTALVVARRGINVAGRRSDGDWRYAISLLDVQATEGGVR
jgi:ketosteroid isomerase-like protein